MLRKNVFVGTLWILLTLGIVTARIHKLEIRNDNRRFISLSTFGFYMGGVLSVNLTNFKASRFNENHVFGFTLDRTKSDAMNPYLESHQEKCLLQGSSNPKTLLDKKDDSEVIYFTMDLKNNTMRVNCSLSVNIVHIYKDESMMPAVRAKRGSLSTPFSDSALISRRKRNTSGSELGKPVESVDKNLDLNVCSRLQLPMTVDIKNGEKYYNTSFFMKVYTKEEEGLYNFYFHSCPNYKNDDNVLVDFTMHIRESNRDNYLSAGEMPLPALYFMMALLFFLSGCFWVFILKKSKHQVFKIHYLMAILVYLKSLSLLFHGINYHFIQTKGEHVAAWAILYYIAHLLKGAVLFITIVLIGTGWTFIKPILADKDKKVFMIVIPLQVLANVAEIIIEESEEGDIEHKTWRDVFILVDLLCCGAIMFPVVWSIRHLQEAAHTDGKAVVNLRKLKLFRHFYIIIVCYIYITRIIVYLMKITVPFQYEWLDEMFREMATYVFFVLTGYKFRPASANPYFTLNDELLQGDDDDEMDVVVTGASGLTEGLSKVSKVIRPTTSQVPSTQEERDSLVGKMESSHEYD
ncbi:protein GPR107 isoform X2 [Leptopilina boulardi]|uniref:protein GPR107 isoform X2 n=1 Tax=Leptopilina boulardi TaxID=63433 RepID=UPI0021F6209B|nr:protein GPR107 isoform X2 [Leptopilina boulardi]